MTLETWTALFGWMTAINLSLLIFSTLMLITFKPWVTRIHKVFFNLSPEKLEMSYFKFLAGLKLLVLVFNLTPYLALRIIG